MAQESNPAPSSVADRDLDTRRLMADATAKLSKVSMLTSAAALVMAFAVWGLTPLKSSVPYVVHVNDTTNEVSVPKNQEIAAFKPQWANVEFFLRRWVGDMFTINQYLTVNISDPRAQLFLRGANAIAEYKAFRAQDDTFMRLAKDPAMTREVSIVSFTPVAGTDNGVVAQVNLTTMQRGESKTETKLLTLYYVTINSTDLSTLRDNPVGVYVTDFKLSDN